MPKWIHNIQGSTRVYQGREILTGDFFQIPDNLDAEYRQDANLISDLALSIVRMSRDGVTDYSGNGSENVDLLKNLVSDVSVKEVPPFAAKRMTINGVTKNLFARNTGKRYAVTTGLNEVFYTATYPWVKMLGVEAIGSETGDWAELRVYDTPAGTYSGVANALLNQFGYELNLSKDFYSRESPFDADLYQGMVIKITYYSISDKTVGVNFIMHEVKS